MLQWTNVLELYSQLQLNSNQEHYYQNGIEAINSPSLLLRKVISNALDLAIAW